MDKPLAIQIKNLTKKFGPVAAVTDVSLSVSAGDIYALIGENGAGKTTIIKMMTGLYVPDKGTISLFGHDITTHPLQAKKMFGYISDNPTVYGHLTGREFFYFTGSLRGMHEHAIKKRIAELMPVFTLGDLIDSPMSDHSRGTRQKIAFIASLLAAPHLIIIDEPIVGLDPDSIEVFGETLRQYVKNGGTVFFSTHILSFAEAYATRAAVIHKGVLGKEVTMKTGVDLGKLYHEKS